MIAAWMLYCSLCALGLFAAALLAERALLAGGGPVRQVWIGAVALSLIVPAAAFQFAPRQTGADSRTIAAPDVAPRSSADTPLVAARPVGAQPHVVSSSWNWRPTFGTLRRANRPLAVTWFALSAMLASYFLVGIIALALMRRRWQRRDVLGVPVFVSERTGPAVVGVVSPDIVMPEWTLAMEPQQLALMLRHEQEHRRVGDAQLLTAAQLTLIVMPWNAALWWLIVRLRMAVELDCDARVLRDADARSYGALLLEVARPRPRSGPRLIGATAFAERAGQLERRIRAIAKRREGGSRAGRAAAGCIGLAAVIVACVAPHPAVPLRVTPAPAAPVAPLAVSMRSAPSSDTAIVPRADAKVSLNASKRVDLPAAQTVSVHRDTALRSPSLRGDTVVVMHANDRAVVPPTSALPTERAAPRTESPIVDSAFNRLFGGIALTSDQTAKARDLIVELAERQEAQDKATMFAFVKSATARMTVQARRDSALRALVMSDADRATLDARLAAMGLMGGGRRGRSGSPVPALGAIGGGPRGGGRGRVGGAGVLMVDNSQLATGLVADVIYRLLFGGIALSPEEEAVARKLIDDADQEMRALIPEPPMIELRLLTSGAVVMRAESKSAFVALLTNPADRSVLESRIAIENRVVVRAVPPGSKL
jgi:hypothetical protein